MKSELITSAIIVGFAFFVLANVMAVAAPAASSGLQVNTEEECVKSSSGKACSVPVTKHKTATNTIVIHCGDSVVYGNTQTRNMITSHVEDGRNLILTKDGAYQDGHCY